MLASLEREIEMLNRRLALKKMEKNLDRNYEKLRNKQCLPKQPTLQIPESPTTKGTPPKSQSPHFLPRESC
jgi:hypothetical protein